MKQAIQASASGRSFGSGAARPVPFPSGRRTPKQDAWASVMTEAKEIGDMSELAETDFLNALRLYQSGKWQRAFEQVSTAADDGNAPAAKLALLMMRYGSSLYDVAFIAQSTRVARWAQVVIGRSMRIARDDRAMSMSKVARHNAIR